MLQREIDQIEEGALYISVAVRNAAGEGRTQSGEEREGGTVNERDKRGVDLWHSLERGQTIL